MLDDLHNVLWMRLQWKKFGQTLWGAIGAVWIVCCAGVLLASDDQLMVRLALLMMLLTSTLYGARLYWVARREGKALEQRALELRAEAARQKQVARNRPAP